MSEPARVSLPTRDALARSAAALVSDSVTAARSTIAGSAEREAAFLAGADVLLALLPIASPLRELELEVRVRP